MAENQKNSSYNTQYARLQGDNPVTANRSLRAHWIAYLAVT